MAHELSWMVPGRVIHLVLSGTMTAEELQAVSAQLIDMLEEGEGPLVHIFADMTPTEKYLISVGVVNRATVDALRHPKLGWTVLITNSRMLRYVGSMVTGISRARYRTFENVEDGLTFLNGIDSTLPDLLARHGG